ncbi:MAG: heme ABC exporter ATP-binding protein CcmA [Robiginitomaculum sp.]
MNSAFTLEFNRVSLARGPRPIVDGFSLEVKGGDLVWLRGDNGMGKTSLLRLAAGFLKPQDGQMLWSQNGHAVNPASICAFQGHRDALKPNLTIAENLSFWGELYGQQTAIEDAISRVNLSAQSGQKAGTLSAGQSRRAALAHLQIANKPIWIMDEPGAAIDASGTELIDDLIRSHIEKGGAALLASHAAPRALASSARQIMLRAAP